MPTKSNIPLSVARTVPLTPRPNSREWYGESSEERTWPQLPERYVAQRKLGEGGLAQVYSAYDQVVGRLVAVKWLPLETGGEAEVEALRLLQIEARIMGRLSHPNILNVYDFGITPAGCYLVLEYCQGRDLFSMVQTDGKLSEAEAKRVILELADCIAYVHQRSVVHGDITPSNVLVSWDGTVKLLDFGIGSSSSSPSRFRWGTPLFSAPEVLLRGETSPASDVFSLGTTAVYLLTGEIPKIDVDADDGETMAAKWQSLAERCIEDISLKKWVLLALRTDPRQRPSAQKWRDTMPAQMGEMSAASPDETASSPHEQKSRPGWKWRADTAASLFSRIPTRRVIFAAQAGTIAYLLHNLSVAGNVLFPVFSGRTRQLLAAAVGAITFLSLRLGLFTLIWSFLPVLLSEVLGWAIVYGVFVLAAIPVVQTFPNVTLQILFFPIAHAVSMGYGLSLLVGRRLGSLRGAVVGACGRFLAYFLIGLAQSPFMGRVLQYGLLTSAPQLGVVASIREGVIPGFRYAGSWPQGGYVLISAVAGILAGSWYPQGVMELLVHGFAVIAILSMLQWVMRLSITWEELLISAVFYVGAGLVETLCRVGRARDRN